eukprot:669797-Rhodomonas_salina.3
MRTRSPDAKEVPSYAPATGCPVLKIGVVLPRRNCMLRAVLRLETSGGIRRYSLLRTRYALSSTDVAYAATRTGRLRPYYWRGYQYSSVALRIRYAMSSTDVDYAPTRQCV